MFRVTEQISANAFEETSSQVRISLREVNPIEYQGTEENCTSKHVLNKTIKIHHSYYSPNEPDLISLVKP